MGLYASLDRAYIGTAEALSAALEAKDSYTAEHSRSVTENAVALGRGFGMDEEQVRMLRYAAAFHDIGKLAISREILNKPGPLTSEERRMIEEHTAVGERILAPIEFLAPIRPMVRHAHERWDGDGYPDGLSGDEIPLGARILFVCDAYDAMTTDRAYRPAMSEDEARAELRACAGTQFDPEVVAGLFQALDERDLSATRSEPSDRRSRST
jgi:HD-GYP domain-containing protein (c-di-GMP phosphodiesterase class II)